MANFFRNSTLKKFVIWCELITVTFFADYHIKHNKT